MQKKKKDIRGLSLEELTELIITYKEKAFRAKQIYEWLWKKDVYDFDEMTNLSEKLREQLKKDFQILPLQIKEQQTSKDKTIKVLFHTSDGFPLEGVLIPSINRVTACISSQTGCSLGCVFCATSRLVKLRNLSAAEIIDQIVLLNNLAEEKYSQKLTNVVMMGMGEPFLNYDEVSKAMQILTSPKIMGWAPSRITISTAGIVEGIARFAEDHPTMNLAISLHTANEEKRTEIMPVNQKHNLQRLHRSLEHYHKTTSNRITIEYLMLTGFNDSIEDAEELASFCKAFPVKINIIKYNNIEDGRFGKTDEIKLQAFAERLEKRKNMIVNIRRSRGSDIAAACGQLANKNSK